ncbi:MAG: hypothetical protein NT090_01165, partial [Acidobacteria bacterium]|nr:hypothetical protein [Acidobacteriota bacterium]
AILEDLKIDSGSTTVWNPPGRIGIAQPSQDTMPLIDSYHVQRVVESEASKQDNRKKLAAVDALERHLFIVVHPRNYPAWVALIDSNVPSDRPSLPTEITDVWVAATDRSKDVYVVWKCTAGQDWRDLGRITI